MTWTLQNTRLRVEIAPPQAHGLASRWSWGGFITQVALDGKHIFCAPESLDPTEGDGGQGLCHEFGIFRPVGFDDAPVGGQFPKIGVGLLRKPDEKPYDFTRLYEIEPFEIEVKSDEHSIAFQSKPLPCNGYAFSLSERIELRDDQLHISCELANVGENPIRTNEYRHNFLALDSKLPNPNWRLRFAPGLSFEEETPFLAHRNETHGDEWSWPETPLQPAGYLLIGIPQDGPHWTLRDDCNGQSISETLQGPFEHLNVWCAPHVVSPEVFVSLDVAPNQSVKWKRVYRFRGSS